MGIVFLRLDEILEIHQDQIRRYGGSPGIRDAGVLRSALSMPTAGFGEHYFHKDVFEMAAAYLFHLVQGHAFIDGNKRTGTMAAFIFLWMNGVTLKADDARLETLVRGVARGKVDKPAIAEFFRQHSNP